MFYFSQLKLKLNNFVKLNLLFYSGGSYNNIFLIAPTIYILYRVSSQYCKNFSIAQKEKSKTGAVKFYAEKFYEFLKYYNTT